MINFLFLCISLFLVIKSADFSIRYSTKLAEGLKVSKYVLGFLLVAVISVLPETFISIASAFQGTPSFGLGTLFGSNVADLTLVFAIVVFVSLDHVKVESRVIKNSLFYLLALSIPIFLGLNGYYSRSEGIILILSGLLFYSLVLRGGSRRSEEKERRFSFKYFLLLLVCMAVLLLASNMTVKHGVLIAKSLHISPVLVAMLLVGLGTTLPELFFSIKAIRNKHDGLAMGDILGTVITDATIVVGVLAIIQPFSFNARIVYLTGIFMVVSAGILIYFMNTGRSLTKREGLFLLFFYLVFVLTEFGVSNYLGN